MLPGGLTALLASIKNKAIAAAGPAAAAAAPAAAAGEAAGSWCLTLPSEIGQFASICILSP